MNIGILSVNPRLYSTKRLREAARERGHDVRVLNTQRFMIQLESDYPDLYYNNRPIPQYDAIVPRIGASISSFGTAVVRQFEQIGVFVGNTATGIANSRDKLRSLQILSAYDIGITPTTFVHNRNDILPAIKRVGGTPIIIKVLSGTQGIGVILAETNKIAEAIIETLHGAKQQVLIQKFVEESKGRDVRAFVIGDEVVAAMRRVAHGTEFRSNIHRGGYAERLELEPAYARTAVRAAQILGLRIAGVDMLEGLDGPQIMEVNSSPGLEGIEKTTGVDVAGKVIEYMENQVAFPDLDIRQRLTVKPGYGVAEFTISSESALSGQTLAECGLRDQDIIVLTIERADGDLIPNPKGTTELLSGDKLLCFGRLRAMKTLLPERPKRRAKKKVKRTP